MRVAAITLFIYESNCIIRKRKNLHGKSRDRQLRRQLVMVVKYWDNISQNYGEDFKALFLLTFHTLLWANKIEIERSVWLYSTPFALSTCRRKLARMYATPQTTQNRPRFYYTIRLGTILLDNWSLCANLSFYLTVFCSFVLEMVKQTWCNQHIWTKDPLYWKRTWNQTFLRLSTLVPSNALLLRIFGKRYSVFKS